MESIFIVYQQAI